ncbi:MAG: ATPase, partial [Lentilitoribacter sp.]
PTILSQCSTVFAMRLANDRDQEIIRSALPNSSTSTTSFLASIGNGEAIAFGEAVAVPMRMMFERVPNYALPSANGVKATATSLNLRTIVEKMRSTDNGKKQVGASEAFDIPASRSASVSPKSDAPLRSAMLASEKQDVPKEERKFSSIMKKESTLRRKPITQDSGASRSAEDLEREMEELRNKLLGQ